MTVDKLNPLNPLLGKVQKMVQGELGRMRWESARVEWTLKQLKLTQVRQYLLRESDNGLYTFEAFSRYVQFPMHLIADPLAENIPIHRDQKSVHPFWFQSFRGLPFVQVFEQHLENLNEVVKSGKPVGMIFPRKGFAQGLVIHNGDWESYLPPDTSCHIFRGGKKHKMSFVVQPYSEFVKFSADRFESKL